MKTALEATALQLKESISGETCYTLGMYGHIPHRLYSTTKGQSVFGRLYNDASGENNAYNSLGPEGCVHNMPMQVGSQGAFTPRKQCRGGQALRALATNVCCSS